MSFRTLTAPRLFDGTSFHTGKALVLAPDGTVEALLPAGEAPDAEVHYGILMPGFVSCHCHLELSHMKGAIPEKPGLIGFVWEVIRNRHFNEASILEAIEKAEQEMMENGIVAVGDICNNTHTAIQKKQNNLAYHNFIEVSGFIDAVAEERFQRALDHYQVFSRHSGRNSIVPHAPYSVAEALWEKIIHFPGNQLLTIHNQETLPENELFLSKQGDFLSFYEKMDEIKDEVPADIKLEIAFDNTTFIKQSVIRISIFL
ncbi:MAG: amidohydrolase, partial [Sphingobacteriales bacterium]